MKEILKAILNGLTDGQGSAKERALRTLNAHAKHSGGHKRELCEDERILAAVVAMLQPHLPPSQITASACCIATLAEEPYVRPAIARSGALPCLLSILRHRNAPAHAHIHAARALCSLVQETSTKESIGSSANAMAALVDHFCERAAGNHHCVRVYVGSALCELTFDCSCNVVRLLEVAGVVQKLLALTEDRSSNEAKTLGALAMKVVCHVAWVREGREALVEAGAVGRMVGVIREGKSTDEESCLAVMYKIWAGDSNQALFKRLAVEARAEQVLSRDKAAWGEVGREMAKKMLDFIRQPDGHR